MTLVILFIAAIVAAALVEVAWRVQRGRRQLRELAESCICATREYPHFAPDCAQHGRLSLSGYDDK